MIVRQRVGAAIERAASEHALLVRVNGFDFCVVQMGGRNEFPHRRVDLLGLHLTREHLRDETVDGGIVVAADDREFELSSLDGGAKRAREVNRHPATAQTDDASYFVHDCFSVGSLSANAFEPVPV